MFFFIKDECNSTLYLNHEFIIHYYKILVICMRDQFWNHLRFWLYFFIILLGLKHSLYQQFYLRLSTTCSYGQVSFVRSSCSVNSTNGERIMSTIIISMRYLSNSISAFGQLLAAFRVVISHFLFFSYRRTYRFYHFIPVPNWILQKEKEQVRD